MSQTSYYTPGVCNLNDAEVQFRTQAGYLFAFGAAMLIGALLFFKVPAIYGFVVFVPAWLAAMQLVQVKNRFCMTLGFRGKYSNAQGRKQFAVTTDMVNRRLDFKRSVVQHVQAIGLGLIVGSMTAGLLTLV